MSFFNFSYSRFVFLFISLFIFYPRLRYFYVLFLFARKTFGRRRSTAQKSHHSQETVDGYEPSLLSLLFVFVSCVCLCVVMCPCYPTPAIFLCCLLSEWDRTDDDVFFLNQLANDENIGEYLHRLSSVNYRENWFRFRINFAINQNRIHSYCIEKVYSCGIIYAGRMIRCVLYSAAWAWLMSFNLIGAPFMSVRRASTWSVCLLSTIHEDRLTGLQSVTSLFQFCVALLYKTPFFLFSFLFQ